MDDIASLSSVMEDLTVHTHSYLPIAASYCRMLNLKDIVDRVVDSHMQVPTGTVVQAMVLDVLHGRSPLYRIEQFLEQQDRELLLGEKLDSHLFNDTNIARALDAIFEAGPSKIITELGISASHVFGLDMGALSYDTTSTSVWGEYRGSEDSAVNITHGHSKDERPDLKQFMTELLCVDRGVPIFGSTLDGNSSDKKSNNAMLSRISSLMSRHGLGDGACIYVADSAMVTQENLVMLTHMPFITRLPGTYGASNEVIDHAVHAKQWTPIGVMAETDTGKNRPAAVYRAQESTVSLYDQSYRAVVIHSSSHDRRRQKKIDKALTASLKELNGKLKKVQTRYFCEEDARIAMHNLASTSSPLHRLSVGMTRTSVRRRGRPPKNGPAATDDRFDLTWEIVLKEEKVNLLREQAGCFVLLTNVPKESLDAAGVLRTYKGQYGILSLVLELSRLSA